MKNLMLVLLILLAEVTYGQSQTMESVSWLIGTWERTNNKPGYLTIEQWAKDQNGELRGTGVLMKGTDTVFMEKLRIVVKENTLNYVADVPENKGLVYFPFTSLGKTSFVCENPSHDFPKKISYDLTDRSLKAIVSAGDRAITYDFKKR